MKILGAITTAILVSATAAAPAVQAQDYPSRPIRLVVPFTPGGNVDITARTIAPAMSSLLGQNIIVENRAGAGGTLGADIVAKAAPDGYTLLMGSNSTVSVAPALYARNPYHPIKDFTPITLVAATPFVLVSHPSVPAATAAELVALAKAQPDTLTMGSGGNGSSNHLVGELFQSVTGIRLRHVPYKGASAAAADLMGGQVQLLFDQLSASTANIQGGRIRALAVSSPERSPVVPSVPTLAELGIKGMDVINITGLLAPAGTSKAIITRLNEAVLKALGQPDVRERFNQLALQPIGGTPETFADYIREDLARWTQVIRDGNIKVD
jgi:tripartite-type tricarboxylate transporter receptor subunit TctC